MKLSKEIKCTTVAEKKHFLSSRFYLDFIQQKTIVFPNGLIKKIQNIFSYVKNMYLIVED